MRVSDPMEFFLIFVMLVALPGCNGNEGQNLPVNTIAVSQYCIGCHANNGMSISPVTGGAITAEWLNSPHNTSNPANKSGSGAGCPNCHTPSHNHPEDCGQCHGGSPAIAASFINPDATLQCNVCHAPASAIKPLGAAALQQQLHRDHASGPVCGPAESGQVQKLPQSPRQYRLA